MFTPHVGVCRVYTSCWSWSLLTPHVGVGHCLHLMLELVIVHTSCWSWSLLTPHV